VAFGTETECAVAPCLKCGELGLVEATGCVPPSACLNGIAVVFGDIGRMAEVGKERVCLGLAEAEIKFHGGLVFGVV